MIGRRSPPSGLHHRDWWVSPNITRSNRFLLVVAHPDDECLFFSPTLLNLLLPRYVNLTELEPTFLNSTRHNSTRSSSSSAQKPLTITHPINQTLLTRPIGHILSLSSGNADGLGLKRTREMRASCWAFGIISDHCIVIDHPELPDSMTVWWPEEKITEFVKLYVDLWKIDLVRSGIDLEDLQSICLPFFPFESRIVHTDHTFPMTMMLESSSLISKYTSLFSLPLSLYRHHQTRKSLLPTFQRPPLHPSRDSERLSKLVFKTLSHFNYSHEIEPSSTTSNHLSNSSVIEHPNQTDSKPYRITDHPLSNHHSIFLSTVQQYFEGRRSFNQHVSQNLWFRRLWLLFSRYMWINELKRVVPIEDRFEPDPKPLTKPGSSSSSSESLK
ncbi:hypothetical protein DFH28DRAFT_966593 [Melampsora americana]|nr:hypothetical protein DFH28DRAFT_966593 [Melampsora americana]